MFVVYLAFLASLDLGIDTHPFCRAQIASMIVDKAFTDVLSKYTDFANIFFTNFVAKLSKDIRINNHLINLVKS